jgi:hypothetical protein
MPKVEDGGLAFPTGEIKASQPGDYYPPMQGMTLRDWFAGQALAGMLAHPNWHGDLTKHMAGKDAYQIADAMLEERNRPNE